MRRKGLLRVWAPRCSPTAEPSFCDTLSCTLAARSSGRTPAALRVCAVLGFEETQAVVAAAGKAHLVAKE